MALLPGIRPDAKYSSGGMRPRLRDGADKAARLSLRGALKYSFMPGIFPRIRRLGGQFGIIAHMLALIFGSAGLLPKGHPMLNPANMGRFGISGVIAAAANNLEVSRKNTDRIVIFAAVVMALVMVVIQVFVIAFYTFMGAANAQDATGSTGRIFTTEYQEKDVVLGFLQQTIGLPNFFNSQSPVGFSIAGPLREMLSFYSTAMMILAVLIVVYYVIIVVGESAQSGKPFGGRFNNLWAPVRLVLALGLLVPLGSGLNAAQYLTLHVAKMGSSLATNAWMPFFKGIADPSRTIVPPYPVGMAEVGKNVFLNEVCMASYNKIEPFGPSVPSPMKRIVWLTPGNNAVTENDIKSALPGLDVVVLRKPSAGGDVVMEWGNLKESEDTIVSGCSITGCVTTIIENPDRWDTDFSCGKVALKSDPVKSGASDAEIGALPGLQKAAFKSYLTAIGSIITDTRAGAEQYAGRYAKLGLQQETPGAQGLPTPAFLENAIIAANNELRKVLVGEGSAAGKKILGDLVKNLDPEQGWGIAAALYIKIAYANMTIQSAIREGAPVSVSDKKDAVAAMRDTPNQKKSWWGTDAYDNVEGTWNPRNERGALADSILVALDHAKIQVVDEVSAGVDKSITGGNSMSDDADSWGMEPSDNGASVAAFLFGAFGVDSLRAMTNPDNEGIFPMVHLINLGNELINKALGTFAGGLIVAAFSGALGSLIFTLGFIGIGIGFLLGIVLPFMPFIYFFFAIVEWVMGVVEALVGVPLWALAHLRIDGDGLPGQAAMNGYYIFLGLLIKPFLILFSLFASFVIFNAGAYFLNNTFGVMVGAIEASGASQEVNIVAGATNDMRPAGPVQFIGYLIVYGIIAYNLGLVSFKMIDTIPAQTMRWLGQSNLNFQDGKPDPIGNVSGAAMTAGGLIGGQIASNSAETAAAGGRWGKKKWENRRGGGPSSTPGAPPK